MEQFSNEIKKDQSLSLPERTFVLINTGTVDSNGELTLDGSSHEQMNKFVRLFRLLR